MRVLRPISAGLLLTTLVSGILPILGQPATAAVITNPSSSANQHTILVDSDDYQILTSGQTLAGLSIQPVTDQDVLYVDASAGQTITVAMQRTSSDRTLNGTLTLADSTGAIIARDDNNGGEGNPLLTEIPAPVTGRYAIQVQDYSGTRTGTYQITATVAEPLVPAASHSILDLETDPCPEPMAAVALPELDSPTTGPKNASFDTPNQELPRTNYPLNCEFARDRQILATTITPNSFTIQNANQSQTTDAFVVDSTAQYLLFDYIVGRKTGDGTTPLGVEVLSGPTFNTVTNLAVNSITGQYLDGWKHGKLPIMAFRGQTIKIRFVNDWWSDPQPSAQVRNIHLSIEVPDWEPSTVGVSAIEYNDLIGAHAVITGVNAFIVSAPFTIPMQTQSLSFNYQTGRRLSNGSAPVGIQVLSGPNFATVTTIDNLLVKGRLSEGWKHASVDIQAFRGQVIKLKVTNDWWPNEPQTSYVDSFKLNRAVPGWDVSSTNFVTIDTLELPLNAATNVLSNTDFELGFTPITDTITNGDFALPSNLIQTLAEPTISLTGRNAVASSAAFLVPLGTTSIQFDAVIGDSGNPALVKAVTVAILSGDSFEIRALPLDNQLVGASQTGSQTALIDIKRYQGKTIKLQFTNHRWDEPTSQLSNFRLVDHVPGWTSNSQPRIQLITDTSAHPSHVYLSTTQSTLVSAPLSLPSHAQQIRFDFQMGDLDNTTATRGAELTVLSGPDFSIRTRIDQNRLNGSTANGWKTLALDLQDLRGQTVKLEFQMPKFDKPYLRVDTIEIGTAVAGWWGTSGGKVAIEPTTTTLGQSARMDGALTDLTSEPITVLSTTVSMSFEYKTMLADGTGNSFISVNVLSGEDFAVRTPIDGGTISGNQNDPNGGWKAATLNLAQFQGRTIKLQFKHQQFGNSVSWFDNLSFNQGGASASHGPDAAPDGSLLELRNASQSAISASFSVPTDTQWLRMEYQLSNLDYGNGNEPLLVDVLSGSSFSTVTFISQGITSQANAGWKVAKLPMSQFQGQTIKIRLSTPQFGTRSVVRVDKLALLSPRATLTTPIVVDGTTYLNVPLTELGGITTTATLTITSLVVYDEYLDLAGQVRYGNTTYPFALTGDLYNSSLGTPGDVVAELQDTTRTFDTLYFAMRQQSFGTATNILGQESVVSLYLQRRGTREAVFVDSILSEVFQNLLEVAFQSEGQYTPPFESDYWMSKILESTSEPDTSVTATTSGDSSDLTFTHRESEPLNECLILYHLRFRVVVDGPPSINGSGGQFKSTVRIINSWVNGVPRYGGGGTECDFYDSSTGPLWLGGSKSAIKTTFALDGNGGSGANSEGDELLTMQSGTANANIYEEAVSPLNIGFGYGLAFWGTQMKLNFGLPMIKPSKTPLPTVELFDVPNDPPRYGKVAELVFNRRYLAYPEDHILGTASIKCGHNSVNRQLKFGANWVIPVVHHVYNYQVLYTYNIPAFRSYFTGTC